MSQIDPYIYPLNSLTEPAAALNLLFAGRTVVTAGHYVANFRAPNQIDGAGRSNDWEVGLLQVDSASAILIVRGIWSERLKNPEIKPPMVIKVVGNLRPSQNYDHVDNSPGVISRLDSSVIVGLTDLKLYDGFILSTAESHNGAVLQRTRLTPAVIQSRIPRLYWQHVSYVAIWWLMAVIVIYLPFYRRRAIAAQN